MTDKTGFTIREINFTDSSWIKDLMIREWGEERVVVHGDVFFPHRLAGFVAIKPDSDRIGLTTYLIKEEECEIITLNSLTEGKGVGTALVAKVQERALQAGCNRLCLTTTNNNLLALEFYQKQGYQIVAVHRDAVSKARKIKPSIPPASPQGIPIRDEIELELKLNP